MTLSNYTVLERTGDTAIVHLEFYNGPPLTVPMGIAHDDNDIDPKVRAIVNRGNQGYWAMFRLTEYELGLDAYKKVIQSLCDTVTKQQNQIAKYDRVVESLNLTIDDQEATISKAIYVAKRYRSAYSVRRNATDNLVRDANNDLNLDRNRRVEKRRREDPRDNTDRTFKSRRRNDAPTKTGNNRVNSPAHVRTVIDRARIDYKDIDAPGAATEPDEFNHADMTKWLREYSRDQALKLSAQTHLGVDSRSHADAKV